MNDRLEISSRILINILNTNPDATALETVKRSLDLADLLINEERNRTVPTTLYDEGVDTMANVERAAIVRTLRAAKWNREKAAKILDIGERTLYRKLQEYRISEKAECNNAIISGEHNGNGE